jgi:hypothetical protein
LVGGHLIVRSALEGSSAVFILAEAVGDTFM